MRRWLVGIVLAGAAVSALWVAGRAAHEPALSAGPSHDAVAAAVAPAVGEVASPRVDETGSREVVDSAPGLDDFAPEQREAVREILAAGQPDAAMVATVHAAMARLRDDDTERRTILEQELLPSAAIARCDVLAVGARTVTVRYRSPVPELGAEVGMRRVLRIGSAPPQREILQRHGLSEESNLQRGRTQTLLLTRVVLLQREGLCVLAGPPRGDAIPDEGTEASAAAPASGRLASIDDFEPVARNAVRDLLEGRSRWTEALKVRGMIGSTSCALVRCEVVRSRMIYRSLVAVPEFGIDVGDRLELSDNVRGDVEQHYGLLPQSTPQRGEERTLVVWSVDPFGFGLYKRWLLLASPPLPPR